MSLFNSRAFAASALLAVAALVAGCVTDPEPVPASPLDEPVDAFNAVGDPQRPGGTHNRDANSLSTDIERLQNARETYELEQERRRIQTQRRQAQCRQRDGSREVAIQDGSGDPNATYCQPAGGESR